MEANSETLDDDLDWFEQDIDSMIDSVKTLHLTQQIKEEANRLSKEPIRLEAPSSSKATEVDGSREDGSERNPESKGGKSGKVTSEEAEYIQPMSLKTLSKICKSDKSQHIMKTFLHYDSFKETFTSSDIANEILLNLMEIMYRILLLPFTHHSEMLINDLIITESFWTRINQFIDYLEGNQDLVKLKLFLDIDGFWIHLEIIVQYILINVRDTPKCIKKFISALESVVHEMPRNAEKIKELLSEWNALEVNKSNQVYEVYPNLSILKGESEVLTKNNIVGKFESIDHYLRVHLPLIKMEMVGLLQVGIAEYLKNPDKHNQNVYVNENVKLQIYKKRFDEGPGYNVIAINLNSKTPSNINYSRRLFRGQLVCLTSSHEMDDLVLAVVSSHDDRLKKSGLIEVDIVYTENVESSILDRKFIMFESRAFVDPLYNVFNTLKNFNSYNFPMPEYIIDVQETHQPPDYFDSLENTNYMYKGHALDVTNTENWPSAEELGMFGYQYEAFKLALTNKLALIQGPPGTGKTYVGQEILSAILQNTNKQVVVLTATNDALDKFILGVCKFYPSSKIVRLGHQSKNEDISKLKIPEQQEKLELLMKYSSKLKSERWRMIKRYANLDVFEEFVDVQHKINRYSKLIEETQQLISFLQLKHKRVIGMTTSFAMRSSVMLQLLDSPIVIVEEAAEIIEPQIIGSLSTQTSQLIMIGDHMQLRPQLNVYKLSVKYKFDISLFERLIINGIHRTQLDVQMRMSPEICDLVRVKLYPFLIDAEPVKNYPNVKGVTKNLFWIDHNQNEDINSDRSSKSNHFEAEYVVALTEYLVAQGNATTSITILTPYVAQVDAIRKLIIKNPKFKTVRIAVLDTFQGEENDIILLSLVRCNDQNDVGFLNVRNRISVMLSRARYGFYIIGSKQTLNKNKTTWEKVIDFLQNRNLISETFTVSYGNQEIKIISHPSDLKKICN